MIDKPSLESMGYEEKLLFYSKMGHSYINMEAIFSDETDNFVAKTEKKGKLVYTIKLRTAKDGIDEAHIIFNDSMSSAKLKKTYSDDLFDYLTAEHEPMGEFSYYFKLEKNKRIYYYNKRGLYRDLNQEYNFLIIPKFETPEWAKGAVMYQIFTDRFFNGDRSNDVVNNEYAYLGRAAKKIDSWHKPVATDDICNFYGGDLKGIMDKMPYLKNLGVDVIFLNPIFVSPSNHKYDIQDYDYIDPHYAVIKKDEGEPLYFGNFRNKLATKYISRTTDKENLEASNKFFIKFVKRAHENGIKIILDGVFNHCGAFNKWLDREGFYSGKNYPPGAYKEKNSPYHNYFRWYADEWPNNDAYDSWWGHDNHPKLDYENSAELYNYIMSIAKKWVSPPYCADGWRLDVAADLGHSRDFNHKFWRDFRTAVKEGNPNAIILAEHYGTALEWLRGDQWDTVMNYDAFMEPITWFLTGMQKHSEEFRSELFCNAMAFEGAMRYHMSKLPVQALHTTMNELSNHDHSRFLTRTNMSAGRLHTRGAEAANVGVNKAIMREAVVFQMTWPGAPTIYYGDEAGLCGWTDPDNRRPFPWGREDKALIRFHKEMILIRKKYKCLSTGSLEYLHMDYGVISYGRWDTKDKIAVAFNNNCAPKKIRLPVWKCNIAPDAVMRKLISTGEDTYSINEEYLQVESGMLEVTLPAYGSIVLLEV